MHSLNRQLSNSSDSFTNFLPLQIFEKTVNMQILVTAPTGSSTAYAVDGSTTVAELKAQIENQEFIPGDLIRLVNGTTELTDGTLAGNDIADDEEIALMLDVPGGMRKKWKKKRMRRLRRKRRKMRQRAR